MNNPEPQKPGGEPLSQMLRIDQICDRFEAAWPAPGSRGPRPRIEDFLGDITGAEGALLLKELLASELAFRKKDGERPTLEEYQERFSKHLEMVQSAFLEKSDSGSSVWYISRKNQKL